MDRIRFLTPDSGSAKAIVHVMPDRALVFECDQDGPEQDGYFRVRASDPSRDFWTGLLKVRAAHKMGALGRVAEAAIRAWDELGGAPWPKSTLNQTPPEPLDHAKLLLTTG